jgi:glycerol uptake facilitator-like aquaporin
LKAHKPAIKALALGFGLFAGIIIGGSTVVLNPAIAAALGSFSHGWGFFDGVWNATDIMWPIVTYIVGTIAGVTIGFTGYRFLLKDSGCDCCEDGSCGCGCHKK